MGPLEGGDGDGPAGLRGRRQPLSAPLQGRRIILPHPRGFVSLYYYHSCPIIITTLLPVEFRGFSSGGTRRTFSEHFPPSAENSHFIFCPDRLLTGKRRIELLPRKCNRWTLTPPTPHIHPQWNPGFRSLFRTRVSFKSHTSSGR